MKKIQDLKCLNGLTLNLLAMALMLCDHMWATVVPGGQWMTNLGRLAFPIFAFQIAEGYARTHNFKRYLGRMFLFALISELPFNLMTGGGLLFPFHQNVMFTFCLALLMLRLADLGRARGPVWHGLSIVVACGLGWLLGTPSAGAALAPDFIQQETENILSLLFINFKPIISDQMPLVNPAAAKARKSELCVAHSAGVGKDIPDVADAGEVHHQPLKTKAESGVTAGAVTPQVAVPPVVLRLHAQLLDAALQHFQPLLTLAAADDFPDAGH